MIRKVYEVNPMTCPRCGGLMRVGAFLTEPAVVDWIIEHLKLAFVAERPPAASGRISGGSRIKESELNVKRAGGTSS